MKLLTPLGLPTLSVGLILAASTALAQPVRFNQADDDHDGFLSAAELEEALDSGELSATLLLSLDQNGDSKLSRDEVRAASSAEGDEGDEEDDGDDEDEGDDVGDDGDEEDSQGGGFDRGEDGNHGHGNSGGFDSDNPGRGHGNDGTRGGGRGSNKKD